jgi:hypothetical protein
MMAMMMVVVLVILVIVVVMLLLLLPPPPPMPCRAGRCASPHPSRYFQNSRRSRRRWRGVDSRYFRSITGDTNGSVVISMFRVTRHTPRVTRHTSHAMRHTSHVTRHTPHVTRHTSHVTRHTSHVTRHTSHVTRHTPRVTPIRSPACCGPTTTSKSTPST